MSRIDQHIGTPEETNTPRTGIGAACMTRGLVGGRWKGLTQLIDIEAVRYRFISNWFGYLEGDAGIGGRPRSERH